MKPWSPLREVHAQTPDTGREAIVVAGVLRVRARVLAVRDRNVLHAVQDVRRVKRRVCVLPLAA